MFTTQVNVSLTDAEKQNLQDFWAVYREKYDEVTQEIAAAIANNQDFRQMYDLSSVPTDGKTSIERMELGMAQNNWLPYQQHLSELGAHYARIGVTLSTWFSLLHTIRSIQMSHVVEAYLDDREKLISAMNGMSKYLEISMAAIGETYLQAKEQTILKQREAILELSTPVLPLIDGLLIMPIVGVVDTHRAQQLTQVLLHAIRDHRARIVVMDITGVPIVDSRVANHLIQSVDAARLMGAKVILTGLSPEVAQALVTVGVNLETITTRGDLQSGIEAAYRQLHLKTVKHEPPPPSVYDEDRI